MRYIICLILLMGLFLTPTSVNAETTQITLDEAVTKAINENRDIEIAKQRLAELKGMKGEALSLGLPQLTGTSQYLATIKKPGMNINGQKFTIGSDNTYVAGAQIDQLLWDGGRVIHAVKAARSEEARGSENIRSVKQQVIYQVKQTFYEILHTEKEIEVLKRQHNQLKSHLVSIRERYNKGLESDYTLMRQDVEVTNVEPLIIRATQDRELLINNLKLLLAIPQWIDLVPIGRFNYNYYPLPEVGTLVEKGEDNRPDLAAEKFHEKSLEQAIKLERTGYWPKLTLNTAYAWQGQSNDWHLAANEKWDSFTTSINLSWPIFDGFKTSSRIKEARAQYAQQHAATSKFIDQVAKDVKDAYTTLVEARKAFDVQQKALGLARKATAIAGTRFEASLMSQLELIDTINAQARAELQYLRAELACLNAGAALELAVGGER